MGEDVKVEVEEEDGVDVTIWDGVSELEMVGVHVGLGVDVGVVKPDQGVGVGR